MFYTQELPTAKMTAAEVIETPRFRGAVRNGEYSRSISIFLRLQYPDVPDLSLLPREIILAAQVSVDNAFFARLENIKELEEQRR